MSPIRRWLRLLRANMNFDCLRFVSERAEIGERREAVFAVTIPEERVRFVVCATSVTAL